MEDAIGYDPADGAVSTAMAGTFHYMSLDAYRSVISVHGDIYALGIMAIELVNGELPWSHLEQVAWPGLIDRRAHV